MPESTPTTTLESTASVPAGATPEASGSSATSNVTAPTPTSTPVLGSVAQTPPAVAAATSSAAPATSSDAATTDKWREAIPAEIRTNPCFANVKDVSDLATQFANAQKLIGVEKAPIPKADSPKEVWDAFYKAAGRPDTVEGYGEIKLPDGISIVDKPALDSFTKSVFDKGLSKQQYDAVVGSYLEFVQKSGKAQEASVSSTIATGMKSLSSEWGSKFTEQMQVANDAFDSLADPELKSLFEKDKVLANNPSVIKLFAKLGTAMKEDTLRGGSSASVSLSPDSPTHALQMIQKLEKDNADVLFNPNHPDQIRRKSVLDKRMALYKTAYPDK